MSKNYEIGKPSKKTVAGKPAPKQIDTSLDTGMVDSFITGKVLEVTKTFRMSADLAYSLKKYALECRQTEKEILSTIIKKHLEASGHL